MKRTILAAGLAVSLGFSLVACGGGDDSGGGAGSVEAWCGLESAFEENPLDSLDPSDIEGAKASIAEFKKILDDAQSKAPEEIADDVKLVFGGFTGLFDELEKADYDFTKVDMSVLESLDSEEFNAASERVDAFTSENCGQ